MMGSVEDGFMLSHKGIGQFENELRSLLHYALSLNICLTYLRGD